MGMKSLEAFNSIKTPLKHSFIPIYHGHVSDYASANSAAFYQNLNAERKSEDFEHQSIAVKSNLTLKNNEPNADFTQLTGQDTERLVRVCNNVATLKRNLLELPKTKTEI